MNDFFTRIKIPALISALLALPFAVLELVNRRGYGEGFPFPLFGVLWLVPVVFFAILIPMARKARDAKG